MIIAEFDLNLDKDLTLMKIDEQFNSPESKSARSNASNAIHIDLVGECPFCSDIISLVLNVQMIVGNSDQMEQYDMMKSGENLHLIESEYDI